MQPSNHRLRPDKLRILPQRPRMGQLYFLLYQEIHTKHEDIHVILFGNKKDLYDEKVKIKAKDRVVQVDKEVIKKFVEDTGVVY